MTTTTVAPTLRDLNDLNALAQQINDNARAKGFWEADRDMGEMLMLAVSELSEALEEHRDRRPAVWLAHAKTCEVGHGMIEPGTRCPDPSCIAKPEGAAVELADCIIRCLDTMHSHDGVNINDEVDAATTTLAEYHEPLPQNFAHALLRITGMLYAAESAVALDRPWFLACVIVRCDELIRRLGVSPDEVVASKMGYNTTRPYRHGKAY